MSNYNELVTILKELLFNRFYPKPEYIRGLLGDGRGNVLVPNRPDYNYVRFNRTSTETFEVFNKEVSQPVDGWPVLIGQLPWNPGLTQVVATDWSAYAQTGWGDSVASIQAHAPTHEWPNFVPGSDAINTYLRAITPMRTQAAGSGTASVIVTSYEYDGATGTNYTWPGLPPFDLTSARPTGSVMRYMGVYLNPATNTLGVVTGATTIYTDALEPDRPAWPRGVYPSAYVRLYGGQAAITERDIRDARRLWDNTLIFTGTGSGLPSGDNDQVLTLIAGVPNWEFPYKLLSPDGSINPAWEVNGAGNLLNSGGGQIDLQGTPEGLILDTDGDTAIDSFTDDTINFTVNGTIAAVITAGGLDFPNGGTLSAGEVDGLHLCEGRLTLTTAVPVTTADVTAATTIYFTPYQGNRLALYNGSKWLNFTFTEQSISLSGFTASKNSDVFGYISSGAVAIERLEWTNDTTRATALATQDGVLVKSGDTTRRYLGTFRTTATTGQCEDSLTHRYVWNYYNRVQKYLTVFNGSAHSYDSTWRAFNNDQANSDVEIVVGVVEERILVTIQASMTFVAGGSSAQIGPGLNSLTSPLTQATFGIAGTLRMDWVSARAYPALGYNYLVILEQGGNTGADPTFNNAFIWADFRC